MIVEILASTFLVLGSLFILLAAIGFLRFPDTLIRMAAVSKASTLGLVLILGSVALMQRELEPVLKILFIVVFTFLTAPVASHLIGRAAYRKGTPLFHRTQRNDLPIDPE